MISLSVLLSHLPSSCVQTSKCNSTKHMFTHDLFGRSCHYLCNLKHSFLGAYLYVFVFGIMLLQRCQMHLAECDGPVFPCFLQEQISTDVMPDLQVLTTCMYNFQLAFLQLS